MTYAFSPYPALAAAFRLAFVCVALPEQAVGIDITTSVYGNAGLPSYGGTPIGASTGQG